MSEQSTTENDDTGGLKNSTRDLRVSLSNEWHARPQLSLPAPLRCSHLVCLRGNASLQDSRDSFAELCRAQGQATPGDESRHHSVQAGTCLVKWEGHTEADSYTILASGNGEPPFSTPALQFLDSTQRERMLETQFVGVHVEALDGKGADAEEQLKRVRALLGTSIVYGGRIADGGDNSGINGADSGNRNDHAELWSAFRLDDQGFVRLVIIDHGLSESRLARYLQRVLELESYRMLAMLALPKAREIMNTLSTLEPELDLVMTQLDKSDAEPAQEALLKTLTRMAARVEHIVDANTYRFAASRAYLGIVERRIAELNESKLGSAPLYTDFLLKSLSPAMRTCDAAENRTHDLAQRVSRATQLLNSMVDMVQKKQNQAILESMAERANLQLRLQQSVEGFSIFAISYYAVGLLSYLLKSGKSLGLGTDPDVLTGLSAPIILGVVWFSVRSVRRHLKGGGS